MQDNNSKKEQIEKVVLDYITKNGNCNISIREIGRLSNANSAAISYYFGSKDNLILSASKHYYYLSSDIFEILKDKTREPKKRMFDFCMTYSEHMIKYIGFLKVQISQYIKEDNAREDLSQWAYKNIGLFVETIQESTGIKDQNELKFRAIDLLSNLIYPVLAVKYVKLLGNIDFKQKETREKYFKSLLYRIM